MYRHSSARALSAQPNLRRGFTLVELLVVITIIAMLVGLLVPAVMMARGAARRTQCINNQRNLGQAVAQYQAAKMKYPPLFDVQPQPLPADVPGAATPVTPPPRVGWVPAILPYIEQNPLFQVFQQNRWHSAQSAYVETLICPARNPTGTLAPLSYVVNAGVTDRFKTSGTNPPRMDHQENGVFFDHYASKVNPTARNLRPPVMDLAYISSHDGTPMTLVLSENLDALDWIKVGTANYTYTPPQPADAGFLTNYTDGAAVHSWFQSMIWHIPQPTMDDNFGITSPTGILLNKRVGTGPPFTSYKDDLNGRPSSNHSGGFIVTMADGSSRMLSEEIEYRVYCLLMSPDSQNVSDPKWPPPFVYPKNWYQNSDPTLPIKPVTDNQIY